MSGKDLNNRLSAIIIDDEEGAIKVLSRLLERLGNVDVIAAEQSPNLGLRHIMVLQPDVVFLDIQMERKSGILLLKEVKELSPDTHVVIVSGYDDYTFEAFKNGASDYLVKPVLLDDLEKAVFRVEENKHNMKDVEEIHEVDVEEVMIRIAKDKGLLSANDILYMKASGSYTEIYTLSGKCEICTRGLWLLEKELPKSFFRIHRSTVINTNYLESVSEQEYNCKVAAGDIACELAVSKAAIESLDEFLSL